MRHPVSTVRCCHDELGAAFASRCRGSVRRGSVRRGAPADVASQGAVVRCGLCVQACPCEVLCLAGLGKSMPAGTPYSRRADAGVPDVRGHPVRAGMPDRRARSSAGQRPRGHHGRGGPDRSAALPELQRPGLLPRLLPRLSDQGPGDPHAAGPHRCGRTDPARRLRGRGCGLPAVRWPRANGSGCCR
jgi:hypothetical protein